MFNKNNMFELLINRNIKNKVIKNTISNDLSNNDMSNNDISNNRYVINKNFNIIPLNIFQTYHDLELSIKIKENVELIKSTNPEFNYYLYNNTMCRNFIKDNFNEDILYTYDTLIPEKFKSELWRYCVLYIYGGIYLNINFTPIKGFKFIQLSNNEYYVSNKYDYGIYNGLIVSLPFNNKLLKTINSIVENVRNINYNNFYDSPYLNSLTITGPLLLNTFFNNEEKKNIKLKLSNSSKYIQFKNINILQKYIYNIVPNNYLILYETFKIYNFLYLNPIHKINTTNIIIREINKYNNYFFTSNPCIIKHTEDSYIMNFRWINYKLDTEGKNNFAYSNNISLNSYSIYDKSFNKISDDIFLENNYNYAIKQPYYGIEDIRIYTYLNVIYCMCTTLNKTNNTMSITSSKVEMNQRYTIPINIIKPSFYNFERIEKNWVFLTYNKKLCNVYIWFPLTICEINYTDNTNNIVNINYKIPEFFKNIKGSSSGALYNNEIWFIVHTKQNNNYQHLFVVFDNELNLLRYSEPFKLDNSRVEFCIGLIIETERTILSFSSLDHNTYIGIYDNTYILSIKWYINNI